LLPACPVFEEQGKGDSKKGNQHLKREKTELVLAD